MWDIGIVKNKKIIDTICFLDFVHCIACKDARLSGGQFYFCLQARNAPAAGGPIAWRWKQNLLTEPCASLQKINDEWSTKMEMVSVSHIPSTKVEKKWLYFLSVLLFPLHFASPYAAIRYNNVRQRKAIWPWINRCCTWSIQAPINHYDCKS